jgi:predicted alpha/beta superfamily hydrolase
MTIRKYMPVALLAMGAFFFVPPPAHAGDPTLPLPVRSEKIASVKVGEVRKFYVSLPDRYLESGERYPVILMLDGEFNFNSGEIGGLRRAARLGEIPEFIVVGIQNTDRSMDCFPEELTYSDGSKAGGRADRFLDFIRAELIPYIDKNYRSSTFRVLYGTSNTGFTAVHALFRDPGLADLYIAASATLRVPYFLAKRDRLIRDFKGGKRKLALVMGENDYPTILSQNGELKEACDAIAPAGLACRFTVVEGAGHVPAGALLEGLRRLFAGWKIGEALSEETFDEIRARVEGRLEKYGVAGRLPEDELAGLGERLLEGGKYARAVEVCRYRAACYPSSADALVGLGEAYRRGGDPRRARESLEQALFLAPGHAGALSQLKELGGQ